ncbi:hypothetical protein FP2506_12914 [Fulvimarina pelagi HTCC2506]|uniref:Uncharacterized protein n=1 Tax=Fulvimarina pelagi HTCC2506 TaxID=314231 RepID=Q0G1B3_9HYPH|nr:hypothetical protein FP2506_12914 [Fulvimarina pelagi HTCC2506]
MVEVLSVRFEQLASATIGGQATSLDPPVAIAG